MADIGALAIQVEALSEGAEKSIQRLTKALAKLEAATVLGAGLEDVTSHLGAIQAQIEKINTGKFGDMVKKIQKLSRTRVDGTLTQSMSNIASTSNSVNRSLGNTAVRMGIMGLSLRSVVNRVASFVKYSLDYTENMNLFMVSMGKYANEAERYANIVSEVMGIDPSTWMRNQGVFMALAEGFGVASDRAYIMSKNLTQLGHDISSFYNLGIEEAFQKLQSGIAGELEPLRRLGIDLSEARLKAIALELGITKTYTAMTQAEKAQLRYHAIMTQTSKVQGDMARTLDAPANQLRILKASAIQAARAIGNTFIPIINSLMPVAIAAANAIRIIASAFASILGFALPTVDYSGISGAANAAGQLDKNLGGAGGSAKELQKALMGFDEINKLPDASGGGGGGGGNILGDDFNFELLEYDFLGEAVNSRVQQLMQKLSPTLDFIKNNADDILQIAEAAGIAFLEWKIASKFLPDLRTGKNIVNKIKNTLLGLTIGYITVKFAFKFTQDFMENSTDDNLDWGSLIASGLTSTFGSALAGLVITQATGSSAWGFVVSGLTLTVLAATKIKPQYDDAMAQGWDKDNWWNAIAGSLEAALGLGQIGYAIAGGAGAVTGAGVGLVASAALNLLLYLGSVNADTTVFSPITRVGIALAKKQIKKFVESRFNFDVPATIDVINKGINNVETAKKDLNDTITAFSESLNLVSIGVVLDESQKQQFIDSITGKGGLIENTNVLLENEENQLKAMLNIAPPQSKSGDDNYSLSLYNALGLNSQVIQDSVISLGQTLGNLLEKSLTNELSASEVAMVQSISDTLIRVEQALAGRQAAANFYSEYGKIGWADLDDASFEQASKEFWVQIQEYRSAIEQSYSEMYNDWQGQLLALNILATETQELMNDSLNAGDTASYERFAKEYSEIINAIANTENIINDFDLEATVQKSMDALLKDVMPQYATRLATYLSNNGIDNADAITNGLATELSGVYREAFEVVGEDLNKYVQDAFASALYFDGSYKGFERGAYTYNLLSDALKLSDYQVRQLFPFDEMENAIVIEAGTYAAELYSKVMNEIGGVIVREASSNSSNGGGGGSPIVAQAQEAGKQVADAFVGAIDEGMKQVEALGNENAFSGIRSQLTLTSEDAKGITTAINEIPSEHAITLNIPGYSTIINRINNIATRVKSIASGTVNIKVKAGVDSGSKAFLLQLASISPSSTLAGQLINLVNVSAFARGGFPKNGELFIANENGSELVGRIGNKTAVANEDQIGDTILNYMEQAEGGGGSLDEERLASVLVRALKNAGVGAVRIDGRDIVRSLNRETQRTGHTPLTIK